MAKIVKPLTNLEVKQAKPRDKEYNLADGGGLALRVKPNGSKLWLFNYSRLYSKKRTNLTFGTYPTVSLADARNKRHEARKLLDQGVDPKTQRDEVRSEAQQAHELTLARVVEQWFEVKKTSITPDYADDIIRSLHNHVLPKLGAWPMHKLTAPLVIKELKPLANTGKLEAVKRICQRLNEVMVFAVNTGLIEHNRLAGIRHAFEVPKVTNNPTLKPEELPKLMKALREANIRIVTRRLIEWQLLTLARPGEAAGTRWGEIDRVEGLWTIPPERMKKRRGHVVPLPKQALALLDDIESISGRSEFVFPSDINPRKCMSSSTANVALKRMGFHGQLTAHGMRALASTTLNEQAFDADLIEAALAHVDKNTVRGVYNRAQYLERRREMMEWWGARVAGAPLEPV